MTETELEAQLRQVITSEIRGFNPDPTPQVMAVLRTNHLVAA